MVCAQIWINLLDYGRIAWSKTMKKSKSLRGIKKKKLLEDFRHTWCRNGVLGGWKTGPYDNYHRQYEDTWGSIQLVK